MNRPRVDTDVPCLRARLWLAKKTGSGNQRVVALTRGVFGISTQGVSGTSGTGCAHRNQNLLGFKERSPTYLPEIRVLTCYY